MRRLLLSNQTNEDNVTLSRKRHDDLQQSCVVVTTFMGLHQLHMVQHKRDSDSQQKMYCSHPSQSRMNHTWCSTRDYNSPQKMYCFHHSKSRTEQFQVVTSQFKTPQAPHFKCRFRYVLVSGMLRSGRHLDEFKTPGRILSHPIALNTIKTLFTYDIIP